MLTPSQQPNSSRTGIPKKITHALRAWALAFWVLSSQWAIANDAPAAPAVAASAPGPAASAPESAEQKTWAIPFSYDVTISSIPVQIDGKKIDATSLPIFNGYTSYDLLTQMNVTPFLELEAVNEWDKAKLMDIKRAILTNFLIKYTKAYLPEDGAKKVYMYCSEACADTIGELLKDTKIEGLDIRPYGAKFSPVMNNEYAALWMNTLVISWEDLWPHDALKASLGAERKEGYDAWKKDGIAERDTELQGELAEIGWEIWTQKKLTLALGALWLWGTTLGLGGALLINRRRKQEVASLEEKSKMKWFHLLIEKILRDEGIRDFLDDDKQVFILAWKRYTLTPHFSLAAERGGTITLESDGKYLMPNGAMVYMVDGSETPTVTPEEFRDFLVKTKRPLPPFMPDDEGDAVPKLTERVLVNLDVEDVNTVSNPLFLTLHKIDMIILNEGFAGKLSFRTDKWSNNARVSRFRNSEKEYEIYVDDAGRVQVIVDNVSTPEGNSTSPFEDVRAVIESIFSDVSS